MGQQHSKSPLSIRIYTSQNRSDQLFDFHKSAVKQDERILKNTSFLVDFGETVKIIDNHILEPEQVNVPDFALYKISQDPYQQVKITALGNDQNKVLWRVIKHGETYPLKIGETLKIGKIQMELKRVVCDKPQKAKQQITQKDSFTVQEIQAKSARSQRSASNTNCRICFQSNTTSKDPLVCLCKCTGSIQYIHFQCLKDWITSGFQKREEKNFKFYTYGEISCELCKEKLPLNFRHYGKDYSFFENDIDVPYAEFESTTVENGKTKFSRYIMDLGKQREILIGRNSTCQVIMKDISISRVHCSLEFKHGMLFVRDKKSKFGTLVKITDSLEFTSQQGIQLQFESYLIELYKKHYFRGCCCFNLDNYRLIYEDERKTRSSNQRQQRSTQAQSLPQNTNTNQEQEEDFTSINPSLMRTRFVRDEHV